MLSKAQSIIIDANQLRDNSIQKRNVKEQVDQLLFMIGEELKEAYRIGKTSIKTSIPTTYSIANMSNSVAQRKIWTQIIEILENKSYRVWINPTKKACILQITWLSENDENDMNNEIALIASHTKKTL
jgi:subtilase family serine protease